MCAAMAIFGFVSLGFFGWVVQGEPYSNKDNLDWTGQGSAAGQVPPSRVMPDSAPTVSGRFGPAVTLICDLNVLLWPRSGPTPSLLPGGWRTRHLGDHHKNNIGQVLVFCCMGFCPLASVHGAP